MNEEYLWDRSGPRDAEVERLERTLAPLRYRHRERQKPKVVWAAAAAVLIAAAGISQIVPASRATAWEVAEVKGQARIGSRQAAVAMPVRTGQVLRTGDTSQLTLRADDLGEIDLGPDSELRAAGNGQVRLRRGSLHAFIWAPPRQFVVDTPSARAVDLGCEYTITMNDSGDGRLRVATGWVAFQFRDRESFIPAGAECLTRAKEGPGIPYYEDAPEGLRTGLADLDLQRVLIAARPRDGLTLWHLLTRGSERDRSAVFDRFAQLVTLPPTVSRANVLRKDPRTIDLCWNALNLENTGWWRGWKRQWDAK